MEKVDYKKQLKHLYAPSVGKVGIVDVPAMSLDETSVTHP